MPFLIRQKSQNKFIPPEKSEGFLLFLIFFISSLAFTGMAFGKDEDISIDKIKAEARASVLYSSNNSTKKLERSYLPSQKEQRTLVIPAAKTRKDAAKKIQSKKIPYKDRNSLNKKAAELPKVDEKGRVNLAALPRPDTQAIRTSILSAKPLSGVEAKSLGWESKPLTSPKPVDELIKMRPNELESLTRPKKEDAVNRIKLVGILQETTPKLALTPEYLTFFARVSENPQSQTLKIRNKGVGTLNYSLSEAISWLSLSSTGGSVTTGEDIITVTIDTAGLTEVGSPYQDEIVVSNNDDITDKEYIRSKLYIANSYGLVTTYSHDPNGNLIRRIDADGNVIEYEYDNANRLYKILYPNGDTVVYEYDKNGNKTIITDKTGITEYIYDQFNRLYAAIFQEVAAVVYRYDNNGNVKKIIYPDSREVNYTYDGDNRLTQVSYTVDSTTYTTTYGYDPQTGNLISKTIPNGVVTTYLYDTADRLTDCINKKSGGELISSYHYILDANGNRTSVLETTPEGPKTTTYEYDELNRLKRTLYPDGTDVGYTYDDSGNRLTEVTNGVTVNYQYDEDNRLIQAGDEIFLYDKRGNLLKKISPSKTTEYTYDYENRLIRYDDGIRVVEYEYNGDGIRISKTVDGDKTIFINDVRTPLTQVLMECTGNWYITKRYVYGRDLISQEE